MRVRARRSALALALSGLVALPMAVPAQQPRQRLAYEHDNRIWSIDAAGNGRELLLGSTARGGPYSYEDPAWSPDGSTLAFVRGRGLGAQLQLRSGAVTRSLTPLARYDVSSGPVFSPDGRTVAFARSVRERTEIATVPAGGGPVKVVTRRPLGEAIDTLESPAWAPGGRLAYTLVRYPDGSNLGAAIYTVRPDGSDRRLLVRNAHSPSWSPDGSRMAFVSLRDRNGQTCENDLCSLRGELYVARADGTGQRRITRNRGDDDQPEWSPDGSQILFSSTRNFPAGDEEAGRELYTVTPEGRCLTWLTNGTPPSGGGAWRPGAGARADAGGCGSLGRRPLIETREPARRAVPSFWLGRDFRGLLLTDAASSARDEVPDFTYDDCGRFRARDCLPPVALVASRACRAEDVRLLRMKRLPRFRGVPLLFDRRLGLSLLFTARIVQGAYVEGDRAARRTVLGGLYRYGGAPTPAGSRLPPPRHCR